MNDKYIPVEHDLMEYPCGLKADEKDRLIKEIIVQDHRGRPTGEVHKENEIWTIASGASNEPDIIWLKEPNGDDHTWDQDSIFEYFEKI